MRTIINSVKQPIFIFLILIGLLSAQQSVAQGVPKIISIEQYKNLSVRKQIDTAKYYSNLYVYFPDYYPNQKLPSNFNELIITVIKTIRSILYSKNEAISLKDQLNLYQINVNLYFTTAFYNKDSLLLYTDKALGIVDKDSSLWVIKCQLLLTKSQVYLITTNDFKKAADIGGKIISIGKIHNDSNYMGGGYITAEEAYYFSFDSLLPVEEYGLKAAQLAKPRNPFQYNFAMMDVIDYLIAMYRKYGSYRFLLQAKQLHGELFAYNQQQQYKVSNSHYYTELAYFSLFNKDTLGFIRYADSAKEFIAGIGGAGDGGQAAFTLLFAYFLSKDYKKFITALHTDNILSSTALLPEDRLQLLSMASDAFAALKQYDSAYLYKKQYSDLKDSAVTEKNAREMNALYRQYNVAQKQHQIDGLEEQKRKNLIIALAVVLLLVSGIFILYTRMRIKEKRMQQQIAQLDTATQYHIYELEEKEKSVKAEERKRLGMELHDGLSGTLAAIKYKTELITPDKPAGQLKEELNEITKLLNEAYSMARNKSHDLYKASEGYEDFSFSERVKLILKNTLPANIQHKEITIDDISLKQIPVKVKIELLQIIKESVTNILKHAKANSISLLLYSEQDEVLLTIMDDGKGFDTSSPTFKKGVGLNSIYQRINDIQGKLNIVSSPGKGTELNITLPLFST